LGDHQTIIILQISLKGFFLKMERNWRKVMNGDILISGSPANSDALGASIGSVLVVDLKGYFLTSISDANKVAFVPPSDDDIRDPTPFETVTAQRLKIGESDVIPSIELALSHCRVGQDITVRCSSKFGYGPSGRTEGASPSIVPVPPYTNLEYEIKVISIQDLETLDLTEKDLQDEQIVSHNSIYQYLMLRRECGNRWYNQKDFTHAARDYSKGIEKSSNYLTNTGMTTELSMGKIYEVHTSLLNNLSVCYINLGE
jgi:hypothetical protein